MKSWIRTGAFLMALGVVMGAFGAHGLKSTLSPAMMEVYQTAVFYHLIHALGLFVVAWVTTLSDSKLVTWAGFLFLAGILLFSGSLYLLAITGLKWLGMITPFGGVSFIAGWCLLGFSSLKGK
jgi:uncharacterized membrane protein YgdD (TMEM256/DUF423 family)